MKKIGIILGIICWLGLAVVAQDLENSKQQPNGNRLESLKIAYITKRLNLSPEEAQRFWPVYNQYASEIRSVRKEANLNSEPDLEVDEKILNVRKKYSGEFSKVLSPQKADLFFRSEKEFGAFVTRELMQRRNNMRLQQQRRSLLKP
ncbi:MAG: hypothetical protein JST58_19815 [Bacteroidetes bacterium]|jgi:hypothetical protein|nr:hypothetical protein [Bacteroidota bacterium]